MLDFHDEISSLSHLLMAGFTAFSALVLARRVRRHTFPQRLSVAVYALSAVALYTASGLFHGLRHETLAARRTWQLLDQTAIFGLIYGSNVPLMVYLLRPRGRNVLLVLLGTFAVLGSALLWLKPRHELLVGVYLAMGVLGLAPLRVYYRVIGWRGVGWVLLLVLFYVGGAVFEALSWPVFIDGYLTYHEVLHVCDMAGTVAHLTLLFRYVLPAGDRPRRKKFG